MTDVDADVGSQTGQSDGPKPPLLDLVRVVNSWQDTIDAIENRFHHRAEEMLETPHGRKKAMKKHQPPRLDIPGFGEANENCGDQILEAVHYCTKCGNDEWRPHNCMQYDCPQHAPYAIRRRAAGTRDMAGMAPKLDALLRWFGAYHDEAFDYSHLVLRPDPDDLPIFQTEDTLEAMKEIGRVAMDTLGVQGAMIYHPWSGENEDPDENDIGKWRYRLPPQPMNWDNLRDELEFKPHLHMIVVHPRGVLDFSRVEQLYEATGWVFTRIVDEETNISIGDTDDPSKDPTPHMARALTYCLSHAGIYEAGDQRRLAAWMKGPDVNDAKVYEANKKRVGAIVNDVCRDTLGISPPDNSCDAHVAVDLTGNELRDREHHPFEQGKNHADKRRLAGESDWYDKSANVATKSTDGPIGPGILGGHTAPSDVGGSGSNLPTAPGDVSSVGGSDSSSSSDSNVEGIKRGAGGDVADDTETEVCGGFMRHISRAGEALGDPEWYAAAPYADDLNDLYAEYQHAMAEKGLRAIEGEPRIPEQPELDPPDLGDDR